MHKLGKGHGLKDLTGRTFGRLGVLARSKKLRDRSGHVLWDCRCTCGMELMVRGKAMLKGDAQSCGCLRSERLKASNNRRREQTALLKRLHKEAKLRGEGVHKLGKGHLLQDLTGQTFGRLTVLGRAKRMRDKSGRALWDCRCTCGKEVMVMGKSMQRGNTKSCGCLRSEWVKAYNERKKRKGMVHFVRFKDDRYLNAVKTFGRPDFIHPHWDQRAVAEVMPGDMVVFAEGDERQSVTSFSYDDSAFF